MKIRLEFKPRDLWIGLYWNTERMPIDPGTYYSCFNMWICFLPMFPIHISNMKRKEEEICQ